MNYPENVLRAVEKAVRRHPSDLPKSVDAAEKYIRKLSDFDGLVTVLVRNAIQDLVYDARHTINRRTRQQAGEYGGSAKVISGRSPAVGAAAESVYLYYIAGTTLGNIRGDQLEEIAESERAIGDGHYFNVRLCLRLKGKVAQDKTVREAMSEKRLWTLFRRAQIGPDKDAA